MWYSSPVKSVHHPRTLGTHLWTSKINWSRVQKNESQTDAGQEIVVHVETDSDSSGTDTADEREQDNWEQLMVHLYKSVRYEEY
jgi:hypothetical protein